jgi:hypothetical protein
MPTAPTVEAPTVMPNGSPTQVSAPDAAFGLDVLGKGLAQAGIAEEDQSNRLAQHAEQFQAINNKAESDGAFAQNVQATNAFVANYKENNPGKAASDNLPAAMTALSAQRDALSNSLSNPNAKVMFDADSRRALANSTGELSRFAATEHHQYVLHQANAVKEALTSDTALHPENVGDNALKLVEAQKTINDGLGLSDEEGALETRKALGTMVGQAALVMNANGDPTKAAAFLEAHKDGMDGLIYEQTLTKLRPALMANSAASDGDAAVSAALHGLGSPTGPTQDFLHQIHTDEGSGQNPRSSASGVGQFLGKIDPTTGQGKGTWFDLMKDPEFAADVKGKTPQEILAMRQDPDVADRAIMVNARNNTSALASAGLPANPATAALAHRFGLGGAEALLRSDQGAPVAQALGKSGPAVVAANPTLANQTVGQVISGFQSRYTGQSVNATAGGTPSSFDLQGRMQAALSNADTIAARTYPGDQAYKDQVEQRAMAGLNRQIGAARDTEFNSYTSLGTAIESGNIQDLNTLLKQPGATAAWNALPLSQRNGLISDMNRNATAQTPDRVNNITTLNGLYAEAKAGNSQDFLNKDIGSMDLPRDAKITFLKAQDTLRNKPDSVTGDKTFQTVMRSPQVAAQLSQMDITKAKSPDDYYHFAGSMQGELDQWNAGHPTQPPGPKDVAKMVANVSAQKYATYGLPGTTLFDHTKPDGRAFDVDDQTTAQATAFLNSNKLPVNAQTIAQYQHERGIIAAQAQARGYKASPADLDAIYAKRVTNAAR